MKRCTKCGELKPLSDFGKHKLGINGINYWCKECVRKHTKAYRDSPAGIYTNLKGVKKHRKGIEFEMSRQEFVEWYKDQEKTCAYCDIPEDKLEIIHNLVNSRSTRLTIDCVDINKGYRTDNIVLACELCNIIKTNFFNFHEMRDIAQKYIKPKWQAFLLTEKANENE